MTQGKCGTCKVRWSWVGARTRRQGVRCPCCGGPLEATTHLLDWPTRLATKEQIRGRPSDNRHCFGKRGCQRPVTAAELIELRRIEPELRALQTPGALLAATLGPTS